MIRKNKDDNLFAQRVAIVTSIDYLPASPSLLNAIRLLADAGFGVDLIAPRPRVWLLPEFSGLDIRYHFVPRMKGFKMPGIESILHALLTLRICSNPHLSAMLAVTQEGLLIAGPAAVLLNLPLVYFSLEVRFVTNFKSRLRKLLEKFYFLFVKFTIIQDKIRARSLMESLGVKEIDEIKHELFFVPNSGGLSTPSPAKSNYLRQRWNIPEDNLVILYIGAFADVSMVHELARSARNWPSQWTLILHGWMTDIAYMEELRQMCDGIRIILSEDVVPMEKLDELVSSADIGIALYKPIDQNVYNMAQSSGKIWQYLRCGLPVISVDFPSLQSMLADGLGICVHHPEEIEDVIKLILVDLSGYQTRTRDYYKLYGDFSVYFRPVVERLQAIR